MLCCVVLCFARFHMHSFKTHTHTLSLSLPAARCGLALCSVPLVLMGDFNSLPDSGVYEFLSTGRVGCSRAALALLHSFAAHAIASQK